MRERIEDFLKRNKQKLIFGRANISPVVSYAEFEEAWTLYKDLTGQQLPKKINCSSCIIEVYKRLEKVIYNYQESYNLKEEEEEKLMVSLEKQIDEKVNETPIIDSGLNNIENEIKTPKTPKPIRRKTKTKKKKIVKKTNKINGKEKPSS